MLEVKAVRAWGILHPKTGSQSSDHRRDRALEWVARIGTALILVQLVVLLVTGTILYDHWDVANDYAFYTQAWYLIAHGNLDPHSTVTGQPFWKNHFELAMWPLAPLYWVTPATVGLKWIQSAAAVASELVAFRWVLDVLRRSATRVVSPAFFAAGFVILLLANADFYGADWFDFHFEAIATLLLVLAARDLYNGRTRRALIWTGLMLLTGDVAGTYALGLGVAALVASRATRRTGVIFIVAGGGWLALTSALGANLGSDFAGGFGYLASGTHVTIASIIVGLIVHPSRWAHVLRERWTLVLAKVQAEGALGIVAPWILFPVLAVLVPAALENTTGFLTSPFQVLPVMLLVPVGTVMVLDWLARHHYGAYPGVMRAVATAVGIAALVSSLAYALPRFEPTRRTFFVLGIPAFQELSRVRNEVAPTDQVIASSAISGGFGGREHVIPWIYERETFPLVAGYPVVFVFLPDDPQQPIPASLALSAATKVARLPGARVIANRDGVEAIRLPAPRRFSTVTLPAGAVTRSGQPQLGPRSP